MAADFRFTPTDTDLLDFLQRQLREGEGWVARWSRLDRGYRLHASRSTEAVPDVREALTLALVRDE